VTAAFSKDAKGDFISASCDVAGLIEPLGTTVVGEIGYKLENGSPASSTTNWHLAF
jgi:hypothetical protein